MKPKINLTVGSRSAWSPSNLIAKSVIIGAFIVAGIQAPVQAQDAEYTRPSWFFGVAGGANFNFYKGSTHQLTTDFTPPAVFHNGQGVGLFVAPLVEFHKPDTRVGFMLQAGYDSRKGKFDQVNTPCNCPADLETKISYVSIEPSLRFAPFKSDFYLYAGPRFAYNISKSFTYKLGINPAYPDQAATADVTGDLSDVNQMQISMQVGAGYDIPLSSTNHQTQFVLSPFVSFHPYFGQTPRSIETWNNTTVRAGVALKLGRGHKIEPVVRAEKAPIVVVTEPVVAFTITSPKNTPVEGKITEIFPIRNYVFFDLGSDQIPDRYVLLKKGQVKDFREDQLEVSDPKNLSGRSGRQMSVYYNILNILGDRMIKNPTTTITLVGSSEKGPEDGRKMSESVKAYLVDIFGIEASRIKVEGRSRPEIKSIEAGGTKDLVLLHQGERRVSIDSDYPVLLVEYQNGPAEQILAIQKAPVESYVTFENKGAKEGFNSWSIQLADEKGTINNFGPYTEDVVTILGNDILGARPSGDYKVTMIGQAKNGMVVKKESTVHVVLWTPPTNSEAMRFSIIFEFNESKAIPMYEKYLNDVVSPLIPQNGTVVIHGHTDVIGSEPYNKELSLERANNVKGILASSLAKAGRSDVKFEVTGFGEDEKSAPFENKYPEERFYNRTVIIDIVPKN